MFYSPMQCKECSSHHFDVVPGHPEIWECTKCGHPNDAYDVVRYEEFDKYQVFAMSTAIYPDKLKVMYPVLGLAGEAGEVCNKLKKIYRDENGCITHENKIKIADELGDVMWYIAMVAIDLGLDFSTIVQMNVEKLTSRKERNTLGGSGDSR